MTQLIEFFPVLKLLVVDDNYFFFFQLWEARVESSSEC